jgi:hypothetical protein
LPAVASRQSRIPETACSNYCRILNVFRTSLIRLALSPGVAIGEAEGLAKALRRRDDGTEAPSRPPTDQDQTAQGRCTRSPAMARQRSTGRGLCVKLSCTDSALGKGA